MYYIYTSDEVGYFSDYINSILFTYKNIYPQGKMEHILNISDLETRFKEKKEEDYFFFLYDIPSNINLNENDKNIYIINTEQLTRNYWLNNFKNYSKNVKIIDYSLTNIELLKPHREPIYYLPYTVNMEEIYDLPKIHDLCFVGEIGEYRSKITNKLKEKGIKINNITKFGKERDDLLFQHKILLNIHFDQDYQIFEEFRCNRCIMNKMIVITEKSKKNANRENNILQKHMIECEYHELLHVVTDVLNNYDKYYSLLFDNFDIDEIKKKYEKYFIEFFSYK